MEIADTKPNNPPQAVRMSDAVRLTGLGRSTLYRAIAAGSLRSIKVGKCRLFRITDIEAFLEGSANG